MDWQTIQGKLSVMQAKLQVIYDQMMALNDRFTVIAAASMAGIFVLVVLARMVTRGPAVKFEGRGSWLGRMAMCATLAAGLALAASGFAAPLLTNPQGQRITGWLLLGHVTFGGLFIAGLLGIAICCAERHRFGGAGGGGRKLFFWLALVLGVVTTFSVLVSMMPLFSSHFLEVLYHAHRWTALGTMMALIGMVFSRR